MNSADSSHKFFGKYQGTVINNIDPMQRGRLLVEVTDVLGLVPSSWAEACVPLAGPTGPPMGVYLVPPIGAGVWVEFAHGDPERPIWVGCRWGASSDLPLAAMAGVPAAPNMVFQSLTQNKIVISNVPGEGITLETVVGAMGPRIVLSATSLTLSCGPTFTVELSVQGVKINGEALVIR